MGVCPQFDILWPLLTVSETLRFYCKLKAVPPADWTRTVQNGVASVDLSHAKLVAVLLQDLKVEFADLRGADFSAADMQRIQMRDFDAEGARFDGANLHGAIFQHGNLRDATFLDADIGGADFDDAVVLEGSTWDGSKVHTAHFPRSFRPAG